MTDAEATMIRDLRGDVRSIAEKLSEMTAEQAATGAKLDMLSRSGDAQLAALFDKDTAKESRLTSIEKSYWPREEQQRFEQRMQQQLSEMRSTQTDTNSKLDRINSTIMKWSGAVGVVIVVFELFLKTWK